MEVHAHTHTAKKKWTHYFWEFLMLFLAVFCGFLAEYQLEHKIEKDREKQYMKSLVEDLKSDTSMIRQVIELGKHQKLLADSIVEIINWDTNLTNHIDQLYSVSSRSTRIVWGSFEKRTADQLKNAGGM